VFEKDFERVAFQEDVKVKDFEVQTCEGFVCKICTTDSRIIKGVVPWEEMKM
jgi:hypothetical protein